MGAFQGAGAFTVVLPMAVSGVPEPWVLVPAPGRRSGLLLGWPLLGKDSTVPHLRVAHGNCCVCTHLLLELMRCPGFIQILNLDADVNRRDLGLGR